MLQTSFYDLKVSIQKHSAAFIYRQLISSQEKGV